MFLQAASSAEAKEAARLQKEGKFLFTDQAIRKLIVPLMLEQTLNVCVGMADSIMVASVGEAAVSGVSLMDTVYVLLIQLFAALAAGGSVVVGQFLGGQRDKDSREAADQLIVFMALVSLGIMVLMYLLKNFILTVVFGNITAEVYGHANTYAMICTASIPFIAVFNAGAAVMRTAGDSRTPMRTSLLMNVINVVGNATLVFGFHLGTAGVAIPTLVSRIIASVVILILLTDRKRRVYIRGIHRFRFKGGLIRKILQVGIPNSVENSLFQLGKILILSLVASFGTSAIAANAVANIVASFEVLPGIAMGFAVLTVISRCIGAKEFGQAKFYVGKLMKTTYLTLWVTDIVILLLLPLVLYAYHLSPETAVTARNLSMLHGFCAMAIWPLAFTLPNVFRASGDAKFPMVVSFCTMIILRIVFAYILGKYLGLGVFGCWLAMILDWIGRTIIFIPHFRKGGWMTKGLS